MIRAFEDDYGVEVRHAWGMTEMSPLGSAGSIKPRMADLPHEQMLAAQGQAGLGAVRRRNEDRRRREQGTAVGRQALRPAEGRRVSRSSKAYFKGEGGDILDEDGFFDTGDVATIDPDGYMQITDRAKDVIKSGGEWISLDRHRESRRRPPRCRRGRGDRRRPSRNGTNGRCWSSWPRRASRRSTGEVLDFLKRRIAKWWMPDDMQVVKEIPHTATGKINKLKLRETFKDYKLPTA